MIESFRHKGLKRLYDRGDRSKLPPDMIERIILILSDLDSATDLAGLDFASYRLHELSGSRKGEWSITVRANWRIVFRIEAGAVYDVNFEDYH